MKKLFTIGVLLLLGVTTLGPSQGQAFNPGAHIYIAEQVFPWTFDKINLYYGSMAPDLVLYASVDSDDELQSLFYATHYDYIDLRCSAWSTAQKAFAKGWLTHNEKWAADHYAHGGFGLYNGYVYNKAGALREIIEPLGIPWDPWGREFAHDVIEVAIDLLLKEYQDSKLGAKILEASLLRSWEDRNLLMRELVWKAGVTDWATLASAEVAFRNIVVQYAIALSLSSLKYNYIQPLVELGKSLAEMYDIELEDYQAEALLYTAIGECEDDYMYPIKDAIEAFQ